MKLLFRTSRLFLENTGCSAGEQTPFKVESELWRSFGAELVMKPLSLIYVFNESSERCKDRSPLLVK